MSAKIVECDQNHVKEMDEYDAYVEQMEEECCQMQVRMEKMDAYVDDLKEHVEELGAENKLLKSQLSQLKKRKADEVAGLKEVDAGAGSKRLRVDGGGPEDKENRENVTVRKITRRSSCIFGIGVGKQKDTKKKEANQSKEKPVFTSTGVLSEKKVSEDENHDSPKFGGSFT